MHRLKVAGLTDVGKKRSENQDSFLLLPEHSLYVVADGMGGHKGGAIASQLSVKTISDYFQKTAKDNLKPDLRIKNALEFANAEILKKSQSDESLHGMGTTTVALYFHQDRLYVGHVGDSRGYLCLPHRIWQITHDHSLVQEKLRAGIITREQIKTDKMKHILTRSVGVELNIKVDVYDLETHMGDVFVICSDGLHGLVEDQVIAGVIQHFIFDEPILEKQSELPKDLAQENLEKAVKQLIHFANENGGDDNVTAIIVANC